MRSLAQSLAREFGPQGVHVAHAIIDGVIDIERTKEWKVSDAPDAKISPGAVRFYPYYFFVLFLLNIPYKSYLPSPLPWTAVKFLELILCLLGTDCECLLVFAYAT